MRADSSKVLAGGLNKY